MTAVNRVRFMANNHMGADGTTATGSSEKAGYPFTNAYNDLRGKIWKPSGNFTIGATNNKLYITFSSTPATITITSGDYATAYDLYTQINTQLDSGGYGTMNFEYSYTTGKFAVLGTSGDLIRLSSTSNAIWDTLGWTTASDLDVGTKKYADQVRSMTSEKINVDLGYNGLVNFIGIVSSLDSPYTLSQTSIVTLKGNNINDFASPPFIEDIDWTSCGHFGFFDSYDDADLTYRYWQIEINDRYNKDELKISYIYLGDYLTIEDGNINNGFSISIIDQSTVDTSESGVRYSDIKTKYHQIGNSSIGFFTHEDKENLMQLFYDVGIYRPFFVSLDPQLAGSSNLGELTKFVFFSQSPTFNHIAKNYYSMSFELQEVV